MGGLWQGLQAIKESSSFSHCGFYIVNSAYRKVNEFAGISLRFFLESFRIKSRNVLFLISSPLGVD